MNSILSSRLSAVVLVASSIAHPALAQSITIPKVAENAFGNAAGGARNGTFRAQVWYSGGNLPTGFKIKRLAPRRSIVRGSAAFSAHLVLRVENTGLPYNGLSATLDQNLSANAKVVYNGAISFPATPAAMRPDEPTTWIPFTNPFDFRGPNLLVEFSYTNLSASGTLGIDIVDACPSDLTRLNGAPGCGTTLLADYSNGALNLFNATPIGAQAPVALLIGLDSRTRVDLTPAGFPGCELGLLPLVTVPAAADAQGRFRFAFPVALPSTFLAGAVQVAHATPRNGGIATTQSVNLQLGEGNYRMLISTDGRVALNVPTCDSAVALILQ